MLKIVNIATGQVVAAYSRTVYTILDTHREDTKQRLRALQEKEDLRFKGVVEQANAYMNRMNDFVRDFNRGLRENESCLPGYMLVDTGDADEWQLSVTAEISS